MTRKTNFAAVREVEALVPGSPPPREAGLGRGSSAPAAAPDEGAVEALRRRLAQVAARM